MKLNPNFYRKTLDAMLPRILEHNGDDKKLTELAVSSHVPLLAVVLYTNRPDVLGIRPELCDLETTLIEFYGYKEVVEWLS